MSSGGNGMSVEEADASEVALQTTGTETSAETEETAGAETSAETEETAGTETSAVAEETAGTEIPAATEESAGEGGTLIAYFSWSGNTEHMAQIIAEQTGGSLFEIEPATPYTDDYDTLLDIAQQEQSDNARPELSRITRVRSWPLR